VDAFHGSFLTQSLHNTRDTKSNQNQIFRKKRQKDIQGLQRNNIHLFDFNEIPASKRISFAEFQNFEICMLLFYTVAIHNQTKKIIVRYLEQTKGLNCKIQPSELQSIQFWGNNFVEIRQNWIVFIASRNFFMHY
jgi:hypothetical protein